MRKRFGDLNWERTRSRISSSIRLAERVRRSLVFTFLFGRKKSANIYSSLVTKSECVGQRENVSRWKEKVEEKKRFVEPQTKIEIFFFVWCVSRLKFESVIGERLIEKNLLLHLDDQWCFVWRVSNTERVARRLLFVEPDTFRRVITRSGLLSRITGHFISGDHAVMRWLLFVCAWFHDIVGTWSIPAG